MLFDEAQDAFMALVDSTLLEIGEGLTTNPTTGP